MKLWILYDLKKIILYSVISVVVCIDLVVWSLYIFEVRKEMIKEERNSKEIYVFLILYF